MSFTALALVPLDFEAGTNLPLDIRLDSQLQALISTSRFLVRGGSYLSRPEKCLLGKDPPRRVPRLGGPWRSF